MADTENNEATPTSILQHALEGSPTSVKSDMDDILLDRIRESILAKKSEIAAKIFGEPTNE